MTSNWDGSDWAGLPEGVEIVVPAPKVYRICVCGHPLERHGKPETEYARCQLWNVWSPCNCTSGYRAVLEVGGGTIGNFAATHRGGQIPSALSQALGKYTGTVTWLVHACDKCGVTVEDGALRAVMLNSRGVVMLGFKPVSKFDSGKYLLLCPGCWESEKAANIATPDREYGRLE